MAISELALVGLSWSLAVNPSEADVQKYQSLSQLDQVKVQQLIEQADTLPEIIEKLKSQGVPKGSKTLNHAPTYETSTGL